MAAQLFRYKYLCMKLTAASYCPAVPGLRFVCSLCRPQQKTKSVTTNLKPEMVSKQEPDSCRGHAARQKSVDHAQFTSQIFSTWDSLRCPRWTLFSVAATPCQAIQKFRVGNQFKNMKIL